ncbi:MAG: hypothetical protein IKI11_11060 [Neisseriaceae bacterium]|nr:hypothetical protein [Neisseriaceae bacterium]
MITDTLSLNGEKFALVPLKMWKKIVKQHPEIMNEIPNKTTQQAIQQAVRDRNNPDLPRYTPEEALAKMQEFAH